MLIEITSYYKNYLSDALVLLFVAVLIVDNVLGHVKAIRTRKWTSKVGTNGILRHASVVTENVKLMESDICRSLFNVEMR